eukprot:scaffold19723_cov97-Phaeocystis_antarctica.AAC.2
MHQYAVHNKVKSVEAPDYCLCVAQYLRKLIGHPGEDTLDGVSACIGYLDLQPARLLLTTVLAHEGKASGPLRIAQRKISSCEGAQAGRRHSVPEREEAIGRE